MYRVTRLKVLGLCYCCSRRDAGLANAACTPAPSPPPLSRHSVLFDDSGRDDVSLSSPARGARAAARGSFSPRGGDARQHWDRQRASRPPLEEVTTRIDIVTMLVFFGGAGSVYSTNSRSCCLVRVALYLAPGFVFVLYLAGLA